MAGTQGAVPVTSSHNDITATIADVLGDEAQREVLARQIASQLDDLRVLGAQEVAELLGVSIDLVYDLGRRVHDPLPMARLGARGQLRIRRSTLRDWLARQEAAG